MNETEQNDELNAQGFSFSKNFSDQKLNSMSASLLAKRRKIRPVSSLQGKKAKLPDCFITHSNKNTNLTPDIAKIGTYGKRVSSAHH